MPIVELLYFPGCPNVPAAREQLRRALSAAQLEGPWRELDLSREDVPEHARGYGSPSILVDGKDVCGGVPVEGLACRVYPGSEISGAPAVADIVAALRSHE